MRNAVKFDFKFKLFAMPGNVAFKCLVSSQRDPHFSKNDRTKGWDLHSSIIKLIANLSR